MFAAANQRAALDFLGSDGIARWMTAAMEGR
jgi:hypothetical protein